MFTHLFVERALSTSDKTDYEKIITTCSEKCTCSTKDVSKKRTTFLENANHKLKHKHFVTRRYKKLLFHKIIVW